MSTPLSKPVQRSCAQRCAQRHQLLQAVRQFFAAAAFLEVDTPISVRAPAPELYIDAPALAPVCAAALANNPTAPAHLQTQRFLQTSPELAMKRLLAAGLTNIYQIAPVFREADYSALHRPEFRLLEWYRCPATYNVLFDDCQQLLAGVARALGHADLQVPFAARQLDWRPPFVHLSVEQAFVRYAGFSILNHLERASLQQQMQAQQLFYSPDDSWEELFHRVYLSRLARPLQAFTRPVFLTDFPVPLAATAQRSPQDARVAERFELIVAGIEVANGFGELIDATVQRQRFVAERQRRQATGKRDYPLDEAFLNALTQLPPTAGIALGLERLLMLLTDQQDIAAVACLAWEDL